MTKILQIIILIISSFIIMSSSCDKGSEGCTDSNACNYDNTAAVDDDTCWFKSEGCDCEDPPDSIIDCLGICDADAINDPPVDSDGQCCVSLDENCDEIVVGGCMEKENCSYDSTATYNDGSCSVDLSQYGGGNNGCDCSNVECTYDDAACGGLAVMNGCENPNCIGGVLNSLGAWKIIISAKATFKSTISDSLLGIDSSTVVLGVSEFALDVYNNVEQEGGNTNCADSCYVDIIENPAGPDYNTIRFYFPHEEWLNEIDSDIINEPNFIQDMRYYDLYTLFSTGIQWDAVITPINLTYGSIVDEISISYKYEGNIDHCLLNISVDWSEPELLEGEFKNYSVNSMEEINLFFNISNVCTDEF